MGRFLLLDANYVLIFADYALIVVVKCWIILLYADLYNYVLICIVICWFVIEMILDMSQKKSRISWKVEAIEKAILEACLQKL